MGEGCVVRAHTTFNGKKDIYIHNNADITNNEQRIAETLPGYWPRSKDLGQVAGSDHNNYY